MLSRASRRRCRRRGRRARRRCCCACCVTVERSRPASSTPDSWTASSSRTPWTRGLPARSAASCSRSSGRRRPSLKASMVLRRPRCESGSWQGGPYPRFLSTSLRLAYTAQCILPHLRMESGITSASLTHASSVGAAADVMAVFLLCDCSLRRVKCGLLWRGRCRSPPPSQWRCRAMRRSPARRWRAVRAPAALPALLSGRTLSDSIAGYTGNALWLRHSL